MSVPAAYIGVILIWATTPLTIKWGSEGSSFIFAVTLRMIIGIACVALLMRVLRVRLVWHRAALKTYLAGTVGIFGAMMTVYWSAQFIPSGWVSVIFGISPIITALLASAWIGEKSLTPARLVALLLGLFGLYIIYGGAASYGQKAVYGIVGVFVSTLFHAGSIVWVKQIDARLPGLTSTMGGLLFSMPLFLLSWYFWDGRIAHDIPARSIWAIVYTGVVATALGFSLFYYVLKHVSATRVGLIALMAPVLALWLGQLLNDEPLTQPIISGTACILLSLALFEYSAIFKQLRRQKP